MIKVQPESNKNILVVRGEARLTDQDYKEILIPKLEAIIREYGKARLLLDISEDFQGWEGAALWDDAHFGIAHRKDFEKRAIIGGPGWVRWGLKLGAMVVSGEIRSFSPGERDEALRWIKA